MPRRHAEQHQHQLPHTMAEVKRQAKAGAADFPFPSAGQDCCHAFAEEASGDVELG